ncbi:zinc metallopeptidase [Peptoniphilus equinus]|uniref:Zinc metallopeptidase n=1 Tax=Peptoniphilus equinus TaxID=3016343 RepID=A0ABY7QR56_9FIRM|nr:zinc metallopeptidase [Peptoniphilus equinus]WBW49254.1 zinc metallopeptidase [Peptoniphilus equinus]
MYNGYYSTYFIYVVPALLLLFWAQFKVKSTYAKYSKIDSRTGKSGAEVARDILNRHGLYDVTIGSVQGTLTDHYDPSTRRLNLSPQVYQGSSVASLGIAAHEVGHAIQHSEGYKPLGLRSLLIPAANLGSNFGIFLVIMGLVFSRVLVQLGIALFAIAVLFTIVTLPVELNASKRAQEELAYVMDRDALAGSRQVLSAAAMTYVASTVMAIAQLLRLLAISRDR